MRGRRNRKTNPDDEIIPAGTTISYSVTFKPSLKGGKIIITEEKNKKPGTAASAPPPTQSTSSIAEELQRANITPAKAIQRATQKKKPAIKHKIQRDVKKRIVEKSAVFMEEKYAELRTIQTDILDKMVFKGSQNERAIKEAIRCILIFAIKLRHAIEEAKLFLSKKDLLDVESISAAVLDEEKESGAQKTILDLLSYIPAKALAVSPFICNLEEKFIEFKNTNKNINIEATLTKLISGINNELKQEAAGKIAACRQFVIQFSESYFELSKNVAFLCSQHGVTSLDRMRFQREVLQEMMNEVDTHVRTKVKNNTCLQLLLKIENSFFKSAIEDPSFALGPTYTKLTSAILSNLTTEDIRLLGDFSDDLKEEAITEIKDEETIRELKQKIEKSEQNKPAAATAASESPEATIERLCINGDIHEFKQAVNKKLHLVTSKHLYLACQHGHEKIVAFLCSKIKFREAINEYHGVDNPLLTAAAGNHLPVIKILVRQPHIALTVLHRVSNKTADAIATDPKVIAFLKPKIPVSAKPSSPPANSDAKKTDAAEDNSSKQLPAEPSSSLANPDAKKTDAEGDDSSKQLPAEPSSPPTNSGAKKTDAAKDESKEQLNELNAYFQSSGIINCQSIDTTFQRIKDLESTIEEKVTALEKQNNHPEKLIPLKYKITQLQANHQTLLTEYKLLCVNINDNQKSYQRISHLSDANEKIPRLHALKKEHGKIVKKITTLQTNMAGVEQQYNSINTEIYQLIQSANNKSKTAIAKTADPAAKSEMPNSKEKSTATPIDKPVVALETTKVYGTAVAAGTLFHGTATIDIAIKTKLELLSRYKQVHYDEKTADEKSRANQTVLYKIQIHAILFEITQLFEKWESSMHKSIHVLTLPLMIKALAHSENYAKDLLTRDELLSLHKEVMDFCALAIQSATQKNDALLERSTYAKKLMAHSQKQQRETITPLERMEYTFRIISQSILFLSYKPATEKPLPEGMMQSALSMLNVRAQMYNLRSNPFVLPDVVPAAGHVDLMSPTHH